MLVINIKTFSQADDGIYFDENVTIDSLLKKAKKDRKLVFIDAYTTYCIPCQEMAQEIFPNKELGSFMNKNFVSISIQIDRTINDTEKVKARYSEAQFIKSKYQIEVFPTYIFIKPDGKLLYKFFGKTSNMQEFLEHANRAISAEGELAQIRQDFIQGKRDSILFSSIFKNYYMIEDYSEKEMYLKEYLKISNPPERKMIPIILDGLRTSQSASYNYSLLKKEAIIKFGYGEELLNKLFQIAFNEIVFPYLKTDGYIKRSGNGVIVYGGKNNKYVKWKEVETKLSSLFPDFNQLFLSKAKITYALWTDDHKMLLKEIKMIKYPSFIEDQKSRYFLYANDILNFGSERMTKKFLPYLKKELSQRYHNSELDYLTLIDFYLKIGKISKADSYLRKITKNNKVENTLTIEEYRKKIVSKNNPANNQ